MTKDTHHQNGFKPVAKHYQGDEAKHQFNCSLDCAYAEYATGGVFGYQWAVFGEAPGAQQVRPELVRITDPKALKLTDFNMIVIDSGSADGDSWKYIYHPATQSGTFIQEA